MHVLMEINGEVMIDTIVATRYMNKKEILYMQSLDGTSVYEVSVDYHKAIVIMENLMKDGKADLREYCINQYSADSMN